MRQGRAKHKDKCWDKLDEITKIFFESHTRLRRELQRFLTGEEKFTIPRCPELVENKAIPACLRVARPT